MTLDECYAALGFLPPLEFEREVYDNSLFRKELGRKRIGSTTHLAVEAALDWYGFKERGIQESRSRYQIVVSGEREDDEEKMRSTLSKLRDLLGDIDESWFVVIDDDRIDLFDDGVDVKRKLVYIDHHVIDPDDRVTGPHRMIRSAVRTTDGTYNCFDRDRRLVSRLPEDALDRITRFSSCPIHVEGLNRSMLVVGGQEYDP